MCGLKRRLYLLLPRLDQNIIDIRLRSVDFELAVSYNFFCFVLYYKLEDLFFQCYDIINRIPKRNKNSDCILYFLPFLFGNVGLRPLILIQMIFFQFSLYLFCIISIIITIS